MASIQRGLALLALALALPLLAAPAIAQDQEERIRQLEQAVQELKAEVERLSAGGTAPGDPARLAEVERRLEVLAEEIERLRIGEAAAEATESEHGFGPAASKVYRTERGLSVGGYGELLYQGFDSERDNGVDSGAKDRLDLLRAVLYFGYKWNDRWLLNTEVEYEHAGEEVSLEFAYVDYLWRPALGFRGGLLLVPMGFVNELHEPTVFLGARRPDVERVLIPTTWRENGVGVFGEAGPVSYRAYVINGFDAAGFTAGGLRGGRQNGSEADAEDLAWVGRVDWTPVPGLVLGGSAYTGGADQDLAGPGGRLFDVDLQMLEGHVEWRFQGLELRGLFVQADLDGAAELNAARGLTGSQSVGEALEGGYLQVGYDISAAFGDYGGGGERSFTPYARWETFNTQEEVPAGFRANPANDVEVLTLGFAFKPLEQLILKVDHQNFDNEAGTGTDQLNVALGYVF